MNTKQTIIIYKVYKIVQQLLKQEPLSKSLTVKGSSSPTLHDGSSNGCCSLDFNGVSEMCPDLACWSTNLDANSRNMACIPELVFADTFNTHNKLK
jgi:hypothetical protein